MGLKSTSGRTPEQIMTGIVVEIRSGYRPALEAAALHVEAEWKATLSTPGRGAPRRDGSLASAPGDPPAPDTFALQRSVGHEILGDGATVKARVGTPLDYAAPLEYGTKDGKLLPRPHLRPTLLRVRDSLGRIMGAAMKLTGRTR